MCLTESKPKFIISILVILCITGALIVALVMLGKRNEPQNQISVSATGKVYARPDIANLTIGLKTEAKLTAAQAVKDNTDQMNEIIASLTQIGIEGKDIKTTNYNLNPVYDWTEKTGQKLKGYEVNQTVIIKIRDLEKIGEVIAQTTAKGANQIGDISFTIDDEFQIKTEARHAAIAKAMEKAADIVQTTGIKLGKIINVYENQVYYPGPVNYAKEMSLGMGGDSAVMSAPEIQVGQNEVQVEMTVVYEVK